MEKFIRSFLPFEVRGDLGLQEIKLIFLWETWSLLKLSLLVKRGHKAQIRTLSLQEAAAPTLFSVTLVVIG